METDKQLKALTDQFVRVRVVQMGGVDLATFQFDPMLSWALFFMHADKTIYGRYGRAHPATKRSKRDSNPNPTVASLKAALERALELHSAYAKDPVAVGKTLTGKTGPEPRWRYAEKTPSARKYKRLKRVTDEEEGCVHCHEVLRTAIDSHFMKRKRVPDRMLWLYPRPAVLGLTMDNRARAQVTSVRPGSLANQAKLKAGDEILSLGGQPLLSVADLQWVLHGSPDAGGPLSCEVKRGGATHMLTLDLPKDWRRAEDFAWRYRMAGYAAWLWAGHALHDDPRGVRIGKPTPGWFKRGNRDAMKALDPDDIVTRVDGSPGMDRSAFLAYLMRDKRLGTKVKLTVLRKGKSLDVDFRVPKKQPEVQGY